LPGVPPLPTGGLVPIGEVAAAAFVKNSESEVVPMAGNPGDIPVVFFFPQGKQKELDQMKKKFADIIKKHKLKFSLIPTLEVPYPQTADLVGLVVAGDPHHVIAMTHVLLREARREGKISHVGHVPTKGFLVFN
jgi:hypothetical protein